MLPKDYFRHHQSDDSSSTRSLRANLAQWLSGLRSLNAGPAEPHNAVPAAEKTERATAWPDWLTAYHDRRTSMFNQILGALGIPQTLSA